MTTDSEARELQTRLNDFAHSGNQQTLAGGLFEYIDRVVTPEVMRDLSNHAFRSRLIDAIDLTLKTPILLLDRTKLSTWRGSATVSAMEINGDIIGFHSIRPQNMRPYPGGRRYNFAPATLAKAVANLHINANGLPGGIAENLEYLDGIGFHYHAGAVSVPRLGDRRGYHLGGSGCEALKSAVSRVLDVAHPRHFAQAGNFDRAFVEVTATNLVASYSYKSDVISPRASNTINTLMGGN